MLMELSSSTGQARQDPQPSCPARSTWPTGQQGDGRGPLDRIPCANLRGLSPCLCVGRPCPRSPAQAPPQSLLGIHVATSPHCVDARSWTLLECSQRNWAIPRGTLALRPLETEQLEQTGLPFLGLELTAVGC